MKTSVLLVDGKYTLVTLDYVIREDEEDQENGEFQPSSKKRKEEPPSQK